MDEFIGRHRLRIVTHTVTFCDTFRSDVAGDNTTWIGQASLDL
jgi:hypothetical protein